MIHKTYVALLMGEEVSTPVVAASVLRFIGCSCGEDD